MSFPLVPLHASMTVLNSLGMPLHMTLQTPPPVIQVGWPHSIPSQQQKPNTYYVAITPRPRNWKLDARETVVLDLTEEEIRVIERDRNILPFIQYQEEQGSQEFASSYNKGASSSKNLKRKEMTMDEALLLIRKRISLEQRGGLLLGNFEEESAAPKDQGRREP